MYFVCLLRKPPELLIFTQAFVNLHGDRCQGKFIRKTRINMVLTGYNETAQLIFKEFSIFSLIY